MKSYILIGPPGSGKSTLATCLAQNFGLTHIDIGSELRRAASENTPFAEEINDTINHKKELVSDLVVYGVLVQALMRVPAGQGVILDGAPRPESQIEEVLHLLSVSGRAVERAIFVELPETESIARIAKRFKCAECAAALILGQDLATPDAPCPACGGKATQRIDDTPDGVRKRYAIFQQVTLPVVEYFRQRGILVTLDGMHTPEALCAEAFRALSAPSV